MISLRLHKTRWAEALLLRNTHCPAQYLLCFAAVPIRNYMVLLVSQGLAAYLQNVVVYNTSLGTAVRQGTAYFLRSRCKSLPSFAYTS